VIQKKSNDSDWDPKYIKKEYEMNILMSWNSEFEEYDY